MRKEGFAMAKRGENIYKRKDGRWEARIIKSYDRYGKAIYAYFYGRTYREAKEKIYESVHKSILEQTLMVDDNKESLYLKDLLDLWLDNSKVKLKMSSYVKYFNLIKNHIKPQLGNYPLMDITSTLLNDFSSEKLVTGKCDKSGGLSEKTVRDILSVVKSVLRFAEKESLLANANINLNLPREKAKKICILSKDEQATLEKYLCSNMDESKLGVLLCLYTGLRIGEICALKWSDVSLEKRFLTVNCTMQRVQSLDSSSTTKTKVIITDPKSTCSTRIIPLPDCILDKLIQFCPTYQNAYFLTGEPSRYIEPRTYQNHFKKYTANCGLENFNFHTTRHSFATRCVEVGFEIKSLSEILGHANVNITMNRYVHPSFDLKRNNMNKLYIMQ